MKDYARKRNHYDLAQQQVFVANDRSKANSNYSNNSNYYKSSNGLGFDNKNYSSKNQHVSIKWLWVIGIAMLVLVLLLIVSFKISSNVEKTHQVVKGVSKKVAQPEFEFYKILSDKKPLVMVNKVSSGDVNNIDVNNINGEFNSDISGDIRSDIRSDSGIKDVKTSVNSKSNDNLNNNISNNKITRVRKMDGSSLGVGPYHISVPGFKSYQDANKLRAELILNNVRAAVERVGSGYRVALPPVKEKDSLASMVGLLGAAGVKGYKVS